MATILFRGRWVKPVHSVPCVLQPACQCVKSCPVWSVLCHLTSPHGSYLHRQHAQPAPPLCTLILSSLHVNTVVSSGIWIYHLWVFSWIFIIIFFQKSWVEKSEAPLPICVLLWCQQWPLVSSSLPAPLTTHTQPRHHISVQTSCIARLSWLDPPFHWHGPESAIRLSMKHQLHEGQTAPGALGITSWSQSFQVSMKAKLHQEPWESHHEAHLSRYPWRPDCTRSPGNHFMKPVFPGIHEGQTAPGALGITSWSPSFQVSMKARLRLGPWGSLHEAHLSRYPWRPDCAWGPGDHFMKPIFPGIHESQTAPGALGITEWSPSFQVSMKARLRLGPWGSLHEARLSRYPWKPYCAWGPRDHSMKPVFPGIHESQTAPGALGITPWSPSFQVSMKARLRLGPWGSLHEARLSRYPWRPDCAWGPGDHSMKPVFPGIHEGQTAPGALGITSWSPSFQVSMKARLHQEPWESLHEARLSRHPWRPDCTRSPGNHFMKPIFPGIHEGQTVPGPLGITPWSPSFQVSMKARLRLGPWGSLHEARLSRYPWKPDCAWGPGDHLMKPVFPGIHEGQTAPGALGITPWSPSFQVSMKARLRLGPWGSLNEAHLSRYPWKPDCAWGLGIT